VLNRRVSNRAARSGKALGLLSPTKHGAAVNTSESSAIPSIHVAIKWRLTALRHSCFTKGAWCSNGRPSKNNTILKLWHSSSTSTDRKSSSELEKMGLTAPFFRDLLCGGIHAIEEHGGSVIAYTGDGFRRSCPTKKPRRMQVGASQKILERLENILSIQEVMNPLTGPNWTSASVSR
jgi:hypothetical protein